MTSKLLAWCGAAITPPSAHRPTQTKRKSNVVGCWVSSTCYPACNRFVRLTPRGLLVTPSFAYTGLEKKQGLNHVENLRVDPKSCKGRMTETKHHQEWKPDKTVRTFFSKQPWPQEESYIHAKIQKDTDPKMFPGLGHLDAVLAMQCKTRLPHEACGNAKTFLKHS